MAMKRFVSNTRHAEDDAPNKKYSEETGSSFDELDPGAFSESSEESAEVAVDKSDNESNMCNV